MDARVPPGPRSHFFGLDQLARFKQDQQLKSYEDLVRVAVPQQAKDFVRPLLSAMGGKGTFDVGAPL